MRRKSLPLETVGGLFVAEAEEVEDGVVDVDFAIDDAEAEFVALDVDVTGLESGDRLAHLD